MNKTKKLCDSFGLVLIFAFLFVGSAGTAQAELNVNINVGPPPIVVSAPPSVVMMPQTGIYFVPGLGFDVFFYDGYWWSPRGNSWYRSRQYKGSWEVVQRSYVPVRLINVPKDYRVIYQKERHINYGQWKKQGNSNQSRGRKH